MATQKIQPDISEAFGLFAEQLAREAQKFQVPILDEAGNLTGESFDIRLGRREQQPQPKRLLEHLEFLRQQGTPAVPGQPIPGFEVTDPFESEGFFDFGNVFKLAAEKSLTGVAFEGFTGKKLVDIEGFQPSKLEEISAEVLAFFSPLDLVALIGGGGVGGLAVKTLAKKAIAKGIAKGLTKKEAAKAAGKSLLQIIPRTTGAIGLHTAASQTLQEKLETGEMSLDTFLDGLAKGGLLGAIVGGAGGVAGLLTQTLSKTSQFAIGLTAEVAALGTASPFVFEDRAPTLADYQHAAEFIVGIKLVGGAARGAVGAYRKLKGENPAKAEAEVKATTAEMRNEMRKKNSEFNDVVSGQLIKTAEESARVFAEGGQTLSGAREAKSQVGRGALRSELEKRRAFVARQGKPKKPEKSAQTSSKIIRRAFATEEQRGLAQSSVGREKLRKQLAALDITPQTRKIRETIKRLLETPLLPPGTGKGTKFGKGFTFRDLPEAKERFLKTTGKKVVQRKLDKGETVKLSRSQAKKTFGDEVLKGKKPENVTIVQAGKAKVVLHEIKKSGKPKLNILSADGVPAVIKAQEVAKERGLPLSISTDVSKALLKNLESRGLIDVPRAGLKFVKVKPSTIKKIVTRESFRTQMAKAVPKASGEQIDATMAVIDARAKVAGESTFSYLAKRFPAEAVRSGETTKRDRFAQIQFVEDGKAVITAFQKADIGSMVHELGHVFRRDLSGSDLAIAAKWAGAKESSVKGRKVIRWNVAADEKFANGFETYLREGKAPNATLRSVFEKLRVWLTEILSKFKAQQISPEIRGVFDRLLSGKAPKVEAKPKDLPKTLFQERQAAQRLGSTFVDRVKKTAKGIIPNFAKRFKNRGSEPEFKQLIEMAEETTFRHHSKFNESEEALLSFGFTEAVKTKEGDIKLSQDIIDGKVPGYNRLSERVFREYKEAGGEAGEITPETAGEFYLRRQLKDEIHTKIYEDLDLLQKDLAEGGTFTEQAIRGALLRRGKELQRGINHLLETGKFKSLRQLLKKAEENLGQRFTTDQPWEMKRSLNLEWPDSFYEKRASVLLPKYYDSIAKRTAELEVFGKGDVRGIKLLSELENKNFEEYEIMRKGLSMWSGQYDQVHGLRGGLRTAADVHAAFQVGTKIALGFAPLLNTTQWIISFMPKIGFWVTQEAGIKLFDPLHRKFLRSTGILRNSDMQALAMVLGRESIGHFKGFDLGRIAQFLSKWSGFTGINRLNLYWAASSIDAIIPKWMSQAKTSGKKAILAQKSLKDLGIDWRKPLTEKARSRAIFDFATKSQLQRNVFEEPLFLNEPIARPFVLFKRFGIRQAAYITDMMTREISRGNYMPLIRFAAAGYAGGASLIWVMNTIRGLLSGEEQFRRTDSFFEGALQNFSTLGAFGFVSDMAELDRLSDIGPKAKFLVMPVFFSDVEKFYEGFTRFLKDNERYGDVFLSVERNAHSVFNIFGSLPRAAAKQLLTPIQRQRRQANLKGRERTEVLNLLLDGKGAAAADRVANWNRANPDKPIRMSDVSLTAIRKYLERLAVTKAGAFGEKGSKEFRKAFREEKRKVRKKVSLTRSEQVEFRRKLLLLKRKFNTGLSNRKAG